MKLSLPKQFFIVFLTICFWLPESTYSQLPFTRKISFLEGLSSDVVYDLFVDKEGLLYLGTDRGLMTYNGVHFEQIKSSESLGNSITNIQQDERGTIWCKNFANQLFFVQNQKLVLDKKLGPLLIKSNSNLIDFSIASNEMYIVTQQTLYSRTAGKIKKVFAVNSKNDENLTSIVYNRIHKMVYVSSTKWLYTFKNNILIAKKRISSQQKVLEVFKGQIVFCDKSLDKSCSIGNQTLVLKESKLDNTFLNRFSATKDDLWLCTNKGIYQYNEKKRTFNNGFLKDVRVTDIVQDLEGNHWISSINEGLFMLPNRRIFELEMTSDKKRSYTCIAKGPNDNYFVGTNDGHVIEITGAGKSIREYATKWDNNIEFVNFVGDTIWTNYGFFRIGNPAVSGSNVYFGKFLEEDDKGNLLFAGSSFGGLISKKLKGKPNFDNSHNKFQLLNYGFYNLETLVLRSKRTKSVLYHTFDKEYYYGFIDGLFVFDVDGNAKEIRTDENEPIIAAEMLLNSDGSVWVASSQRGVFLIKNKKVTVHFSSKNGLSNDNCRKIAKDEYGLWIITDTGFDYYDSKTKHIKNAELNLCFKGITINDVATVNQFITLTTNKGIYYFEKKVLNQVVPPRFAFTSFLVNNKKRSTAKNLQLNYAENNINIKFKTIHYKSLGEYNYRYRLKGLDEKWHTLPSNAKNINFLALTPDDYKFEINLKIGDRYTPIQEINFTIAKPFWLQIWFLAILMLVLLALMYFVYRWTELKTRKSAKLKEQLALSQLTALRSQMNPHFIFNVLNAVQGLIYSNQKSKASDYLGKFSDLMRKILDTSDKNEVTIEKEFETIDLYISLEKARFDSDFEYKITFPEAVDLSNYLIPSMIIQPFVENAIKHGLMHKSGYKQLDIKVEKLEDVWCFTIEDNGIGRKASEIINQKIKKHISFATKAIENRVKLINKITNIVIDIEVIDKKSLNDESLGTRIKIYIPTD